MLTTKETEKDKMTKVNQKISKLIESDNVVLFMKGDTRFSSMWILSQCNRYIKLLRIKFSSFNVLEDNELREGIKKFLIGPQSLKFTLTKNLLVGVIY